MKKVFLIPTTKRTLTEAEQAIIHRIGVVYMAVNSAFWKGAVNGATTMCGWAVGVIAVMLAHNIYLGALGAALFAWGIVSFQHDLRLMKRRVEEQLTKLVNEEPKT